MKLEPRFFFTKAGDVLFWHANLIHGGSPRKDLRLSRKALVCHYFAEGVVTYHDLSGKPVAAAPQWYVRAASRRPTLAGNTAWVAD